MKLSHIFLSMAVLTVSFSSCELQYEEPPLNEPSYVGEEANMTLAALKKAHATASEEHPDTVKTDIIIKAYVSGNDEGGNIYKTLYVQDSTAAIALLLDQGSVYSTYRVGQEVYINLNGMVISSYGGELQIGYPGAYLFRTDWTTFQKHVVKNGWANPQNAAPLEISDLSKLNEDVAKNAMRAVRLSGVRFADGGKLNFAEPKGYGNRTLMDAKGNSIAVRTSNYAKFANTPLPIGTGNVEGILGRFNGGWQLLIRTINDVQDFSMTNLPAVDENPVATNATTIFSEDFGAKVERVGNNWPSVDIYTGWSNSNLSFSDPVMTGSFSRASVRTAGQLASPHLWMAAKYNSELHITGFTTAGYDSLSVSYDIAANLSDGAQADQNAIQIKAGDKLLEIPSKIIKTSNTFQKVTVSGIPAGFSTLTLISTAEKNTVGFRIDNVKVEGYKGAATSSEGTPINPTN